MLKPQLSHKPPAGMTKIDIAKACIHTYICKTGQTGGQAVKADCRSQRMRHRSKKAAVKALWYKNLWYMYVCIYKTVCETVRLNETKWKRRYANSQIYELRRSIKSFPWLTYAHQTIEIYMGATTKRNDIWVCVCVCMCTESINSPTIPENETPIDNAILT